MTNHLNYRKQVRRSPHSHHRQADIQREQRAQIRDHGIGEEITLLGDDA